MRKKHLSTFILTIILLVCTSIGSIANGLSNTGELNGIIAQSAIVMDMDTGEIIASKNAKVQRPVASTMKLLTSLIYAENTFREGTIPFTEESLKTTQSALNNLKAIQVGDEISCDDLMKAVMIYSANDAAYLMADSVSGNYLDFVDLMNERVEKLGLKDTKVVNPCGLESNALEPESTEINLSTAYDMAIIASEAFKNEWIRETVSKKDPNVSVEIAGQNVQLKLRNKILGEYGNVGGKTGNETQAGHCFVGFFQREGRSLVTVVLGSEYGTDGTNVFNDTKTVADDGYQAQRQVFKKAGEEITKIELTYRKYGIIGPKKTIEVPVIATDDIMYYKNPVNDKSAKIKYTGESKSAWKLADKTIELDFNLPNYSTKVTGKVDLTRSTLMKMYGLSFVLLIVGIFGGLFLIAYSIRLKNLKRKRMVRANRANRTRRR